MACKLAKGLPLTISNGLSSIWTGFFLRKWKL